MVQENEIVEHAKGFRRTLRVMPGWYQQCFRFPKRNTRGQGIIYLREEATHDKIKNHLKH